MENFSVTKIVNYLKKYENQLDNYEWGPTKYDRLLSIKAISEIELYQLNSDELNYFQKDEKLKNILSKKLQESYSKDKKQFDDIALWIIRDWGGIYSGSNSDKGKEKTLELVYTFIDAINGNKKPKFKRIASTSKVAGFMYPNKNIIYDSRVSYTVNWIILSKDAGSTFFPIPEGRNPKMRAFDLDVLIRLKRIESYKCCDSTIPKNIISNIDKKIYISEKDAYYKMNNLICEINKALWEGEDEYKRNEPFYTEMLLFSLADTVVYKEITDTVSLNINN